MKKSVMIRKVTARLRTTKPQSIKIIEQVINTTLDVIIEELVRGGEVSLRGFGTFATKETPARTITNPRTGKVMQIPKRSRVCFTVGKSLKATIRRGVQDQSKSGSKQKSM